MPMSTVQAPSYKKARRPRSEIPTKEKYQSHVCCLESPFSQTQIDPHHLKIHLAPSFPPSCIAVQPKKRHVKSVKSLKARTRRLG